MNTSDKSGSELSVLGLRVDVLDDRPDWPVVTILVDDRNPFEQVAAGWRGFDPGSILGPDSPLVPRDFGRRVAVQLCSCGIAGCGVIAPVITASPDGCRISWVDFRDWTGVFDRPTVDTEITTDGSRWNLPDLHFSRDQYLAEVARACADRSWETRRRAIARLVDAHLRERDVVLPPGLPFAWASPARVDNGISLMFRSPFLGPDTPAVQQMLQLSSAATDPVAAAADIIGQLSQVLPEGLGPPG